MFFFRRKIQCNGNVKNNLKESEIIGKYRVFFKVSENYPINIFLNLSGNKYIPLF